MKIIVFSVVVFSSITGLCQTGKFPMDAKTLIEIGEYNSKAHTYEIIDVVDYGQGPWYTTPEDLVKAVPTLDLKRILKNPEAIVHNQYSIDNKLMLTAEPAPAKTKRSTKNREKNRTKNP